MVALAATTWLVPAGAQTEGGAADRRSLSIYRSTQSPFCPGRTLDDCPSEAAAAWRADIREWVEEGASGREIRERLQARAPDVDLSGRRGVPGWLFALLAFGAAGFGLWAARRLRRRAPPDTSPAVGPELDARLDEELARLERS